MDQSKNNLDSEDIVKDIDILKLKTMYNIDFNQYEKEFLKEYKEFVNKNCNAKFIEEIKDIKTFNELCKNLGYPSCGCRENIDSLFTGPVEGFDALSDSFKNVIFHFFYIMLK